MHSASYCDVDENGVWHMVFFCVIMGNMEPLCPGMKQFHPSTEDFDTGVDDLQNPRHYIVWNMNMNTHFFFQNLLLVSRSCPLLKVNITPMEFSVCFYFCFLTLDLNFFLVKCYMSASNEQLVISWMVHVSKF